MSEARIAILASGNGTTAEAYIRAGAEELSNARVDLVICNNPDAGIFARVAALNKQYGLNVKAIHISHLTHPPADGEELIRGQQTQAEEQAIIDTLDAGKFDAILLLGYMKLIGPKLVREFGWRLEYVSPFQARLLNTHPGLLPLTKGLYGIYAQSHTLKSGAKYGGHTLHVVSEAYDEGPVLSEHKVVVKPDDTAERLFARVQESEKQHLPTDVDEFIQNRHKFLKGAGKDGQ